ncbi:AlpA family phage regulatory protein [Paracoccus sp. MBLB3053]|uniref:AlpA family phage regulatory protein n=1 Tax=Paracoccus aurantius TaxID=3073814 RepID=A0ABU2HSA2_9RHOB|nr:AlpA family phage regulatory protein [Paracoccus sp. MBLB3053]MDS9467922.1 AlpA family phage regulatory protein [Paracoccus sp. MBLB3053]
MTEEIWRLPRVIATVGMGRSWIYWAVGAGRFPSPLRLGARAVGWKRSEVEAWVNNRTRGGL